MVLLFKSDITMPNSHCIVEQCVPSLKRKLKRNEKYHEEYTASLTDVIDKGHAEVMPDHQFNHNDGKNSTSWGVPPKKKSLRVVFDFGSVFQLNIHEQPTATRFRPPQILSLES